MNFKKFFLIIVVILTSSVSYSLELDLDLKPFTDSSITYDFFSPNNDSINDFFIVKNIETYRDYNKLSVFNRWGDLVYEASPYNNDWDGTTNQQTILGKELPEGVYLYRFEYKILDKETSVIGKIILKR
jgi:gliding motility-associated-like protein